MSRIRFHLRDDEVKYDLRLLLDAEHKFDLHHPEWNERHSGTRDRVFHRGDSVDFEENIQSAFIQQPNYADRHISSISGLLGPLNEPCLGNSRHHYQRSSRRARANRVNYSSLDDPLENTQMYNHQEVHFYVRTGDKGLGERQIPKYYNNNDGEEVEIPVEERGHNVTIGNFTVSHGSVVRLNYLGNNTTIDAQVVNIKKNQLFAVTLVGKKRRRIWYKDLRIGKINIAPATAYR